MMKTTGSVFSALWLLFLLPAQVWGSGELLDFEETATLTVADIVANNVNTTTNITPQLKYDIDLYRIFYNSSSNGTVETLSGLVMIPQVADEDSALGINVYHHGTIIPGLSNDNGPSDYTGGADMNIEYHMIGSVFASAGHIVALPDYAGYGLTGIGLLGDVELEHPYLVASELAETSIDFLRATNEFLGELEVSFEDKLYITGWSEGGYAAMATLRWLETKYSDEFHVDKASLLAGPYDYVFNWDVVVNPVYGGRYAESDEWALQSWTMYSFNAFTPALQRPNDEIFAYSVSNMFDSLFTPSNLLDEIIQTQVLDSILNKTDTVMTDAILANSLVQGWVPSTPLYLHHGLADALVVPDYSMIANETFSNAGAQVVFYAYPNGTHESPAPEYVLTTLRDFAAEEASTDDSAPSAAAITNTTAEGDTGNATAGATDIGSADDGNVEMQEDGESQTEQESGDDNSSSDGEGEGGSPTSSSPNLKALGAILVSVMIGARPQW